MRHARQFRVRPLDEQILIAPPMKDQMFWREENRSVGRPSTQPTPPRPPLAEFGPAEGDRYFVCQATGYDMELVARRTGYGSRRDLPTSYSVIDSAYDREVARFSPSTSGGGRTSRWAKQEAEKLCAAKNQDERDWENGEGEYAPRKRRPSPTVKRCKRGHPFSGKNIYEHGGKRYCRACRTLRLQPWWKRKPAV